MPVGEMKEGRRRLFGGRVYMKVRDTNVIGHKSVCVRCKCLVIECMSEVHMSSYRVYV